MRNVPSVIPCVRLIGVSDESADWLEEFGAQLVESTGALAVCSFLHFRETCPYMPPKNRTKLLLVALHVNLVSLPVQSVKCIIVKNQRPEVSLYITRGFVSVCVQ